MKAATISIVIESMYKDPGLEVESQVNTVSRAARRLSSRRGAGRVRRVEVRELCAQERVCRGELSIIKARGEDNVASVDS